MSKPLFSLLHATDRHPQWAKTSQVWLDRCDLPETVEHILVTGVGTKYAAAKDILLGRTLSAFSNMRFHPFSDSRGGTDQWNWGAHLSTGHILIKMADDLIPPQHWDTLLDDARPPLDSAYVIDVAYRSREDGPLLDCGTLIPHAIITRPYYERFGYLEHPDYSHNMADVEFSDVAHASGCVIKRHDIVFIHKNPEDGSAEWDEVYQRQRTPEKLTEARAIYEKRKSLGFPKESVLPLKCEDVGPGGMRCEREWGHTGNHYSTTTRTLDLPTAWEAQCTV